MKSAKIWVDKHYHKERLFDLSNAQLNRDNCLYPWWLLREKLKEKEIYLSTEGTVGDINIFVDNNINLTKYVKNKHLILLEPEIIQGSKCYEKEIHDKVETVFTWRDDLVDNDKFIKIYYPNEIIAPEENKKRYDICIITGVKQSITLGELYSERLKAMQGLFPVIHSYGHGINPVVDKIEVLKNYKFAICYENNSTEIGYISEKIIDCFKAGTIPIYWGAPNITDHIPSECFIDKRTFKDYGQLWNHLITMPEEVYSGYVSAIKDFMQPGNKFSSDNFATTITKAIVRK